MATKQGAAARSHPRYAVRTTSSLVDLDGIRYQAEAKDQAYQIVKSGQASRADVHEQEPDGALGAIVERVERLPSGGIRRDLPTPVEEFATMSSKWTALPCTICGEDIPGKVIGHRRRLAQYCCSVDCEVKRRTQAGFYKAISVLGRAARSAAVAKSNHENPRRKKKEE